MNRPQASQMFAGKPDVFWMWYFKVHPCSKTYSHDWTVCPFFHPGEKARRRDLEKYPYCCVPCQEFKETGNCSRGNECQNAHGIFETWLHPGLFRTQTCMYGTDCTRPVCFFAHTPEERRSPPMIVGPTSGFAQGEMQQHQQLYSHFGAIMPMPMPMPMVSGMSNSMFTHGWSMNGGGDESDVSWVDRLVELESPPHHTGPAHHTQYHQAPGVTHLEPYPFDGFNPFYGHASASRSSFQLPQNSFREHQSQLRFNRYVEALEQYTAQATQQQQQPHTQLKDQSVAYQEEQYLDGYVQERAQVMAQEHVQQAAVQDRLRESVGSQLEADVRGGHILDSEVRTLIPIRMSQAIEEETEKALKEARDKLYFEQSLHK